MKLLIILLLTSFTAFSQDEKGLTLIEGDLYLKNYTTGNLYKLAYDSTKPSTFKTINSVSILGAGNIDVSGGAAAWGAITGTLSSQSDLNTALGLKANQTSISNIDNTSDANKPVSSATQTALDLKAPLASPTFTGTVSGVTASMISLGNVDNTSDATKNAASAVLSNKTLNAFNFGADAGANDSYVITLSPAPAAYTTGMIVVFKANTVNTGAASINVNSLGAKTIVKRVSTALANGDIPALSFNILVYDGTNFKLLNPVIN